MIGAARRTAVAPPALPGFEHVDRFFDPGLDCFVARVNPGELYVTDHDEAISTVLGSCISVCARDPNTGVGGLNHFMLPASSGDGSDSWIQRDPQAATRYGNFAMEQLLNEILKRGARRRDLELKVVGGGSMFESRSDIGGQNIAFVRRYVAAEGLRVISEDLGDQHPRQVRYFPKSGRMQVRRLPTLEARRTVDRDAEYRARLVEQPVTGDIELF